MLLCEAAGYRNILVETVGVGQSETAVRSMVDFFLLLMLAGAGDELQGIKRGIIEMTDLIAINKADGDNRAEPSARAEYASALHLFPRQSRRLDAARGDLFRPAPARASREIWETVLEHHEQLLATGLVSAKPPRTGDGLDVRTDRYGAARNEFFAIQPRACREKLALPGSRSRRSDRAP